MQVICEPTEDYSSLQSMDRIRISTGIKVPLSEKPVTDPKLSGGGIQPYLLPIYFFKILEIKKNSVREVCVCGGGRHLDHPLCNSCRGTCTHTLELCSRLATKSIQELKYGPCIFSEFTDRFAQDPRCSLPRFRFKSLSKFKNKQQWESDSNLWNQCDPNNLM